MISVAILTFNFHSGISITPTFCFYMYSSFKISFYFQWNMLRDSIHINSFCCNSVVLKNYGKTSNNCFFGPNLHSIKVRMGYAQNEKQVFFGRNNKSRSSAFKNFLLYQNIICFGWAMNLFLFSVMFFYPKRLISS